jgi:hypothetical protein
VAGWVDTASQPGQERTNEVTPYPKPDRSQRRSETHCKRGHSLADAYVNPRGVKECRECSREANRRWKKRHPEQTRKWSGANMKVERVVTCPDCGGTRTVKLPRSALSQKLCIACAGIRRRGRRLTTKTATCPCGTVFVPTGPQKLSRQPHCSPECRRQYGGYEEMGRKQAVARTGWGNPAYRHGKRTGVHIPGWSRDAKGEHSCRNCGSTDRVELHHAIPRGKCKAIAADLRNGLPLCMACHRGWHAYKVVIYRDVFTKDEWDFLCSVRLTGERVEAWLDGHYPERPADVLSRDFRLLMASDSPLKDKTYREGSNLRWELAREREDYMRRTGRDPYIAKIRGPA